MFYNFDCKEDFIPANYITNTSPFDLFQLDSGNKL